mgnify:CR=1 FL=1
MITRPSAPSVLAIQFGIERHDVDLSLTEEPELASRGVIVNDPHPQSGGYQLVVFDPKALKVHGILEDMSGDNPAVDKADTIDISVSVARKSGEGATQYQIQEIHHFH